MNEFREKEKRAFSNLGGAIRSGGDPALAEHLVAAWEAVREAPSDVLTHGFHAWPARMHFAMARVLLERFPTSHVLDPFCGGGTVLIEARRAGAKAFGIDLNPLSLRLCEVKTDVRSEDRRARFLEAVAEVAKASEARVRARVPIQVKLPRPELSWYEVHVLKELGGLLEEIRAVEHVFDQRAMEMLFSSILIKVSKQRSETDERIAKKRIRKGLVTEFFVRKADELVERWAALEAVCDGPPAKVYTGDARRAARFLKRQKVSLILTSPPYGGTYDYAGHHARRLAFLGLDASALHRFELGARRNSEQRGAVQRWDAEVSEMLGAMRDALEPNGHIVLVMGDGLVDGRVIPVPEQLSALAPPLGLSLCAFASQPRPEPGRKRPRYEHVLVLQHTKKMEKSRGRSPRKRTPGSSKS